LVLAWARIARQLSKQRSHEQQQRGDITIFIDFIGSNSSFPFRLNMAAHFVDASSHLRARCVAVLGRTAQRSFPVPGHTGLGQHTLNSIPALFIVLNLKEFCCPYFNSFHVAYPPGFTLAQFYVYCLRCALTRR